MIYEITGEILIPKKIKKEAYSQDMIKAIEKFKKFVSEEHGVTEEYVNIKSIKVAEEKDDIDNDTEEPKTIKLQSTNIDYVKYYPNTSGLDITFHSGGKYHYSNIGKQLYEKLINAQSPGSFYHIHIKGKYPSLKLE